MKDQMDPSITRDKEREKHLVPCCGFVRRTRQGKVRSLRIG